jgi:hypothetical protein
MRTQLWIEHVDFYSPSNWTRTLSSNLSSAFAVYDTYDDESQGPSPLEIEAPEILGGWTRDAMGRDHYPFHGIIEEVSDDYSLSNDPDDVYMLSMRPRSLPEFATPPPAPVPRVMELFSSFIAESLDSDAQQYGTPSPQPTRLSMPSTPEQNAAMFMYGALLHQDLETLRKTQHELQVMTLVGFCSM